MQIYEIGGCVRDEILGRKSNDIDFSVVLSEAEFVPASLVTSVASPFDVMVAQLKARGFKIFLETPEHFTVRAQFPETFIKETKRPTADFVLARKESGYTDGRRPDHVQVGTLEDDIMRRDFTMNALAKADNGTIIDMVGGVQDINDRVIRAVGNAYDRLREDALRAVRALRFSVTLGFRIDPDVAYAMQVESVLDAIRNNVSDERIKDELSKMLRYDTVASLKSLQGFPLLTEALFSGSVSLDATMKEKGRGKK